MCLEERKINIAIDGYSSCGKSTLAKSLADSLHYIFIDSGAMYRSIALYALENNLIEGETVNKDQLLVDLSTIECSFGDRDEHGIRAILLNGRDVSKSIRSIEVSNCVSQVAAIKEVRRQLVRQQQFLGIDGGIVMDGRDIGTVVFPDAELKLFLTASHEVRAQRRFLEMQSKGQTATLEEVKANLIKRVHIDSTREESPLKQAEDAIIIDNSFLSEAEQLTKVLELVSCCKMEQLD